MTQPVPSVLYKYMPEGRKDFFDNYKCELTLLGDMDILFDYAVGLAGAINPAIKISSIIKEHEASDEKFFRIPEDHEKGFLNGAIKFFCPFINDIISEQKKREAVQQAVDDTVKINEKELPKLIANFRKKFYQTRILNLIEHNNSVAIWTTYAYREANTAHSGFMLGLDTEHTFFHREKGITSELQKVMYPSPSRKWYVSDLLAPNRNEAKTANDLQALLHTKNESFSFEHEWRTAMVTPSSTHASNTETIPCDMIKNVYLGARASSDLKKTAFSFCNKHAIPLFQMIPSRPGTLEPELVLLL
ncbi:DUF2971 domain-containing protein [Desulfovibrio sp. UIB00]|uniref:DUF2971 domain-containing protein n=1 Tax=Desulfovibrio sp. UIB00 TaxID=2804314 RepID=UPI001F10A2C7|nr:DUF2971 domain-containing protein [Desulfovibrio sp. UIB00]MCH5144139.1 DUF2971 domain-containing protein [Desulfovibrio sp. UIB00]